MKPGAIASIAFAIALLGGSAHADDCEPSTSSALTVENDNETYYAVVDPSTCPGCSTGVHVFLYEETNGMDGLQRKDVRRDDTCNLTIQPDAQWSPS